MPASKARVVLALFFVSVGSIPVWAAGGFGTNCGTNVAPPCMTVTSALVKYDLRINDAFTSVFSAVPGYNPTTHVYSSPMMYDPAVKRWVSVPSTVGSTGDVKGLQVGDRIWNIFSRSQLYHWNGDPLSGARFSRQELSIHSTLGTNSFDAGASNPNCLFCMPSLGEIDSQSSSGNPALDLPATGSYGIFGTVRVQVGGNAIILVNPFPMVQFNNNLSDFPAQGFFALDPSIAIPAICATTTPVCTQGSTIGFFLKVGVGFGEAPQVDVNGIPILDGNGLLMNGNVPDFSNAYAASPNAVLNIIPIQNNNDSGAGSVRQAMLDADAGTGAILDATGLPNPSTINLLTSLPSITKPTFILGANPAALKFQGTGSFPILQVGPGVPAAFCGLTISNGGGTNGGGVNSSGHLFAFNDSIVGNHATNGAGFYQGAGGFWLFQSTVSGNTATAEGGGFFGAPGVGVTVDRSIIANNSAAEGAGLYSTSGTVFDIGSYYGQNTASGCCGGAVYLDQGAVGNFVLNTFYHNQVPGYGSSVLFDNGSIGNLFHAGLYGNTSNFGDVYIDSPTGSTAATQGNVFSGYTGPACGNCNLGALNIQIPILSNAKVGSLPSNLPIAGLPVPTSPLSGACPVDSNTPPIDVFLNPFTLNGNATCGPVQTNWSFLFLTQPGNIQVGGTVAPSLQSTNFGIPTIVPQLILGPGTYPNPVVTASETGSTLTGNTANLVNGIVNFSALSGFPIGSNTIQFGSTGFLPVTSNPFIVLGPASNDSLLSGGGQSAQINSQFGLPIQIKVTDAAGDGIANFPLTFTGPVTGPGVLFGSNNIGTANTNGSGIATSPSFTANGTAGGFNITVTGNGIPPINVPLTNLPTFTFTLTNPYGTANTWSPTILLPQVNGGSGPITFTYDSNNPIGASTFDPSTGKAILPIDPFFGDFVIGEHATVGNQSYGATFRLTLPPPVTFPFDASATTIDKIATSSGEFYDFQAGLSLGGPLPLGVDFFYSSELAAAGFNSALGTNWMHNFDEKLVVSGSYASALLKAGKTVRFQLVSGVWTLQAPARYGYQLVSVNGGYQLMDPESLLIYTFNSSGVLTAIADRNSNTLTVTQGANGPVSVADGLGRTLTFTYNGARLSSVADQAGRSISFAYTGSNLTSFTDANGKVTTYSYANGTSYLTGKTRPVGNTPYTQTYNASGQVLTQSDSGAHATTLAYDLPNYKTTLADPLGHTQTDTNLDFLATTQSTDALSHNTSYTYDSNFHNTSVTDRRGNQSSATFHPQTGYLASATDALGNTTNFTFTAQPQGSFTFYNLTKITYADNTTQSFTYDASGNLLTATDQAGKSTTMTYNTAGQVLTRTNPGGGVATVTYNSDGTMHTAQSPAGDTRTNTYDNKKRLIQVKYADNTTVSFTYDNMDRPLTVTDERGNTVTLAYDANGNTLSRTDALTKSSTTAFDNDDLATSATDRSGYQTTFQYDSVGNLTATTNGAGEKTTSSYDALNRLTAVTDPAGKSSTLTYDAEGNLIAVQDGLSNKTQYTVDALGRATQQTSPLGEVYSETYDKLGRITSVTDPLSHATNYSYDARGSLIAINGPLNIGSTIARNDLGYVTGVTDPNGNNWQVHYDSAGRLTSRTDPLNHVISYSFDSRNRLSGVTMPLGTVQITKDNAGNETQLQYSDSTTINLTYDADNRVTAGNGLALSYDDSGRVKGSNGLTITRDGAGRIAGIVYGPGKSVTYTRNTRGLLSQVSDWTGGSVSFAYDDAGRVTGLTRSNGTTTQYTHDADGRVTAITETAGAQTLGSITEQRDSLGRIVTETRNLPQAASPPVGQTSYTFDAADQISGATYDSMGRLTNDGSRAYTWNLASELTSYTASGSSVGSTYDAFGQRISRGTQNYVLNYALGLPSIATVQSGASDQRYYIYAPDGSLLYAIDATGNQHHFYHFDAAGSTTFLTDDGGHVTDSYGITPYGESVTANGSTPNPFTWLGQWGVMQEGSSGLFYMRSRYYDSVSARFVSRDPLDQIDPQAVDPYQYVSDDPISTVDPTGLKGQPATTFFTDLRSDLLTTDTAKSLVDGLISGPFADSGTVPKLIAGGYKVIKDGTKLDSDNPGTFVKLWVDTTKLTFKGGEAALTGLADAHVDQFARYLIQGEEYAGPTAYNLGKWKQYSDNAKTLNKIGKAFSYGADVTTTIIEDVHNGAGGVETTNDVAATVAAKALVVATPLGKLDGWTGGQIESIAHNGFAAPATAVDVIAGRVNNQKADAIKKIYTKSLVTKGIWWIGDHLIPDSTFDFIFK